MNISLHRPPISLVWLAAAIFAWLPASLRAQQWLGDEFPVNDELPVSLVPLPEVDPAPLAAFDQAPLADDLLEPPRSSQAARSLDDDMGPPGEERSPFRSRVYWIPTQKVLSQPDDWSQAGEQINLAAPLYIAPGGGNLWLATGTIDHLSIDTGAILPDSQLPVPDNLWKIEGGAMNFRELDNGWKTAAILKIGSVSDQPFDALRDMTVTTIGSLEVPYADRDAWNFSFFYSPTSQLPYPLPGLAYIWRPNEKLRANIGIPFSLQYRPTETFSIVASYFPLTDATILATRQLSDSWSVYGGYQVVNETYWLADRLEENQLFYMFDQRLTLGLRRKLVGGLSLDFTGGYVFDREVFQADGFSDNRRDRINIDPGALGAVQLIWSL
ncbi:MAG: hypothetical protein JNL18_08745 [Planctomycetaceae bacterium]|nr:hypothetical protein [Planctomycetaceae bacterium]